MEAVEADRPELESWPCPFCGPVLWMCEGLGVSLLRCKVVIRRAFISGLMEVLEIKHLQTLTHSGRCSTNGTNK